MTHAFACPTPIARGIRDLEWRSQGSFVLIYSECFNFGAVDECLLSASKIHLTNCVCIYIYIYMYIYIAFL